MHLLIIPSWYPKSKTDPAGSFFREQAIALSQDVDRVGVLSLSFLSIKYVFKYKSIAKYTSSQIDDNVFTYRKGIINFFPRMRLLQKKIFETLGLRLFEKYIAENGRPDIIHAHSILYGGFLAKKIKDKYGIPYVLTEHSSIFLKNVLRVNIINDAKGVVESSAYCFAVSNYFAIELERIFTNKWSVINNIVDSKFLENPNFEARKEKKDFYFLSVCYLNKNKQVDFIIKAFARKFKNVPHVKYRIGGDGEEKSRLVSLAKNLGVDQQIEFLGELSRDKVIKYMEESHVFLLGSRFETFSVVVVEALALGLPVIATECGGPNSIITNNKVGLLSPVGDINLFSDNMYEVYANFHDYDPIGIRNYCKFKYSSRVINEKLLKYYDDVIHG